MSKQLIVGITSSGVRHRAVDPDETLETKFQMVRDSGVFDYLERTPQPDEIDEYRRLLDKYDVPLRCGSWFYTLGRDEPQLEENLKTAATLGSIVHNTQIMTHHADGHMVTDEEVAECYLRAYEVGEEVGCKPTFEVHVNMWNEDYRRVSKVADLVEARGIPYRMTLDHSHVIFKMDNPEEQEVQNMRPAVKSGELILDPFVTGNVCDEWIQRGIIWHCHARAAAPGGPKNIWAKDEDGSYGRGIQYPFIEPGPDEWHSEWDVEKLEPWKEVVRHLLAHHAAKNESPLMQISTEFIVVTDYGAGSKYSNWEHSLACARWIREEWGRVAGSPSPGSGRASSEDRDRLNYDRTDPSDTTDKPMKPRGRRNLQHPAKEMITR